MPIWIPETDRATPFERYRSGTTAAAVEARPLTGPARDLAFEQLMGETVPAEDTRPPETPQEAAQSAGQPRVVLSCDLGQADDRSALTVIEYRPDGTLHIADAKLLPKGQNYVAQVGVIIDAIHALALPGLDLIVVLDLGSAGRACIDMLRAEVDRPAGIRLTITGLAITPGTGHSGSPRSAKFSCSKTKLPDAFSRLIANEELTFGPGLPRELQAELLGLEIQGEDSVRKTIRWAAASGHDDAALSCLQGVHAASVAWGANTRAEIVI